MTAEQLIAFNVALVAAMASPGPALLVLIRTAVAEGRLAGVACGCGLATMAATWTLLALLGLEGIVRMVPWLYAVAKVAGALYLIYLAVKTWRGARDALALDVRPVRHAFRDGVLVNLANPKSVLFAAAVLVVIFPAGLPLADKAVVVANHLVVELTVYAILATALGAAAVSRRYLRAKFWLDRFAAVALGALGARLLASR